METIAVYWESKIRTYGINLLEGLFLYRFALPSARAGQKGGKGLADAPHSSTFQLVWAQSEPIERMRICVVCDENNCQNIHSELISGHGPVPCEQIPVDILWFQGPHFGDRYGIMDFTLQALAPHHVPIVGSVCAMATVYLVLPDGWGRTAADILNGAFEIPRRTPGREK